MVEWHKRTKQWHNIYNLVIFSIFGFLYVNGLPELSFAEAMSKPDTDSRLHRIRFLSWSGVNVSNQKTFCNINKKP